MVVRLSQKLSDARHLARYFSRISGNFRKWTPTVPPAMLSTVSHQDFVTSMYSIVLMNLAGSSFSDLLRKLVPAYWNSRCGSDHKSRRMTSRSFIGGNPCAVMKPFMSVLNGGDLIPR